MNTENMLLLRTNHPLKAQNAGLFISRGGAMHPTRIISSHELIFVKEGALDMWENEQEFHLEAGQSLHLWPGRQHGSTKPMPLGLKFYWIHFDVENDSVEHDGGEAFTPFTKVPQVKTVARPERLEHLFRMFLDDQEIGALTLYTASLLTSLMLAEVAHVQEDRAVVSQNVKAVVLWAHTYIKLNYQKPLTAGKIAEMLRYNPDYLGRIYAEAYGCTLTEAIHQRRIHEACKYLLDTEMTIEQIAQKCGFADPDYFRRIFRRYMQTTPGIYRRNFTRIHVNTH
jgi:AraC-like DNA-binding protein